MTDTGWSGDGQGDSQAAMVEHAFRELARAQRGLPEAMATSIRRNPHLFHATGVYTLLAEHVGDLTHRMTEHGGLRADCGFGAVAEKVARGLRYARDADEALADNVGRNIRNNYGCRVEDGRATGTFGEFKAEFLAAAQAYADAHASLAVFNDAQWHAREAAVCLGHMDFGGLVRSLEVLERGLLQGRDAWCAWAGAATVGVHGVEPFCPAVDAEENAGPAPAPGRR